MSNHPPPRALLTLALAVIALALVPAGAHAGPLGAPRARLAILELRLADAANILEGADRDDPDLAIERARLGLYRGECDSALATLQRPDLDGDESAAALFAVAKGCARGTAATMVMHDEKRGVTVRFGDDADRPLFPLIARAAGQIRDMLARELGTRLPDPVFIDLVRDQFTLAALSGLPESAAKTTGTVAVAKWGRVMMITPRAAPHGYPWLDTLAHEMTHLVLSQATRDRAPLWLQEGVAKREEGRWRVASPFDGVPPADAVAALGIERGLGLPLTKLGPSIAMLPSPEQATVAFAEVSSFVDFWVAENGPEALPKLLAQLRDALPTTTTSESIQKVSKASLDEWDKRWRAHLKSKTHQLPPDLAPGAQIPKAREISRFNRLGTLLLERGHAEAAKRELSRAHALIPSDAGIRCSLAAAAIANGDHLEGMSLVRNPDDIRRGSARWWSLHDVLHRGEADEHSRFRALSLNPLLPQVSCEELPLDEWPSDPTRRALCHMARSAPR
jgi:hypothetical protein